MAKNDYIARQEGVLRFDFVRTWIRQCELLFSEALFCKPHDGSQIPVELRYLLLMVLVMSNFYRRHHPCLRDSRFDKCAIQTPNGQGKRLAESQSA